MKLYVLYNDEAYYEEDCAMAVLAKNEDRAEKIARETSPDFKTAKNIVVEEVDTSKESCVLIDNVGA